MDATTLLYLIERFERNAVGHSTLEGAMIATFGIDWEVTPEYREVASYVTECMTYDSESGDWF